MNKLLVLCFVSCSLVSMRPPAPASAKGKLPAKEYDQKLQNQFVDAVSKGNYEQVKRMLKFRPKISVDGLDSNQDRPLEIALANKNLEIAELLLKSGANPNLRIMRGMTPGHTLLMEAVGKGSVPLVELLVSYGADINAEYNDPITRGKSRKAIDFIDLSSTKEDAKLIRELLRGKTKIL